MLRCLINEFRAQHGVGPANFCDSSEDENCFSHCLHMTRIKDCCHAPDYLLNGKAEAVGVGSFYRDTRESVAQIIFDVFKNSPPHRDTLLMPNLACAMAQSDWHVFVTVRGWL